MVDKKCNKGNDVGYHLQHVMGSLAYQTFEAIARNEEDKVITPVYFHSDLELYFVASFTRQFCCVQFETE